MNRRSMRGRFIFAFLGCLLTLIVLFLANASLVSSIAEHVESVKDRQWFKVVEHVLSALIGAILFELFTRSKNNKAYTDIINKATKHVNTLAESASNIGLTHISSSRFEIGNDLLSVMEAARSRILILGIGFSGVIKLLDVADLLQKKVIENIDVRLLLLNPLSKEAVTRTLLESSESEAQNIIGTSRERKRDILDSDPFFALQVFCDSNSNIKVIDRYEKLKPASRFYSHAPSFWMIIIDDLVFWQPYTMGSPEVANPKSLGPLMPVFRFEESSIVQNLRDHFEKEWGMSTIDLFHMIGMLEDKKKLLYNIFRENKSDFSNLVGVLRTIRGFDKKDRRRSVRRHCQIPNLELNIEWRAINGKNGEAKIPSILTGSEYQKVIAKIENFNSSCLAVRINNDMSEGGSDKIQNPPGKNQIVNVTVAEDPNSNAFRWFKKQLIDPTQGKMKVYQTRQFNGETVIILRPSTYKDHFNLHIQRSLSKISAFFL